MNTRATNHEDGGRLLKVVEALALSPAEAEHVVANYRSQLIDKNLSERELRDAVAKKIGKRYATMAALVGGTSGLVGLVPGMGKAVALAGGAVADAAVSMKLQVDMCMCMAVAYGYDLTNEDARHLSFLLAAGGALEKAGEQATVQIATKAGVKMLREHLKGAALKSVKEMFKNVGIVFTRKSMETALPAAVGVLVGGSFNYALTRYVSKTAQNWFALDAAMEDD